MPAPCLKPLFLLLLLSVNGAHGAGPCADFVARLPNLQREMCEAAALQASQARTVKGRTIWMRDIKAEQPSLRVLVVGAIHGDEPSSAALSFHWIKLAAQTPALGAYPVHWRFVPVLNPDGLFNRPARRVNARGVDLNRNFSTSNWEHDAKSHWEKRTRKDPRRWPGPSALSEPESRFLDEQMRDFKPHLIVSLHAPYGVLDFDGPLVPPSRLGNLYLHQIGVFPGSLGNYGALHNGMPVVTIELPNATRTPREAEIRRMWKDLLTWMTARLPATQKIAALPVPYLDATLAPPAPTAR